MSEESKVVFTKEEFLKAIDSSSPLEKLIWIETERAFNPLMHSRDYRTYEQIKMEELMKKIRARYDVIIFTMVRRKTE